MPVNAQRLNVGTTPTLVDQGSIQVGSFALRNRGTGPIHLGAADVTPSTGFQIDPGESITIELRNSDPLYAVAAAGTQSVHVIRLGS